MPVSMLNLACPAISLPWVDRLVTDAHLRIVGERHQQSGRDLLRRPPLQKTRLHFGPKSLREFQLACPRPLGTTDRPALGRQRAIPAVLTLAQRQPQPRPARTLLDQPPVSPHAEHRPPRTPHPRGDRHDRHPSLQPLPRPPTARPPTTETHADHPSLPRLIDTTTPRDAMTDRDHPRITRSRCDPRCSPVAMGISRLRPGRRRATGRAARRHSARSPRCRQTTLRTTSQRLS
jgi:hypothetical protein